MNTTMKKLLLAGIAALLLAPGTAAHSADKLPDEILGLWCQAGVKSEVRKIFFRPSFAGREHCVDFDDGVTFDENGFSNDSVAVGSGEQCEEYVFDKVERVQDAYIINARCGKAEEKYNPAEDDLGGTLHLQIIYDGLLLVATRTPEG